MMNLKNYLIKFQKQLVLERLLKYILIGEEKAIRVKKFIENLKHSKGIYAGKPFILENWQYNDIIKPLYETLNPDGTRQYRTCLIMVAK